MPDDVSRACACFLIILAYTLGAQDMRNVTTRVGTWHPGGLRFGLRLPVRRQITFYPLIRLPNIRIRFLVSDSRQAHGNMR